MANKTTYISNDNLRTALTAFVNALEIVEVAPAKEKPAAKPTKVAPAQAKENAFYNEVIVRRAKERAEGARPTSEDNKALAKRIRAKAFASRADAMKAIEGRADSWTKMVERAYA